jgi:uncharacterized membrane protein
MWPEEIITTVFSLFCHQLAERSPHFFQHVLPVCSRCAGMYSSFFLLISCRRLGLIQFQFENRQAIAHSLLLIPAILDGAGNMLRFWNSSGEWRLITGYLMGAALYGLLCCIEKNERTEGNYKLAAKWSLLILIPAICLSRLIHQPPSLFFFNMISYVLAAGLALFVVEFITTGWKIFRIRNTVTQSSVTSY